MLQAWSGEKARPSSGRDWAAWIEEAIGRVAGCNARLAKEKGRARGARVRSCTKKIQLAEIQLQRDPENVEVRGLLSEAQGQLAEEFQDSVVRNRHISSANWLRTKRHKRGKRLREGWMHVRQRSLEPSRPGVEKLGRAWNELPRGEQEMQGDLHRQHPLAHVRRSHPSKKRGLG
ncbi:unnamed protein product [Sphagnum troendelagicum]